MIDQSIIYFSHNNMRWKHRASYSQYKWQVQPGRNCTYRLVDLETQMNQLRTRNNGALTTLCSEKNTHSHFPSYLHEW